MHSPKRNEIILGATIVGLFFIWSAIGPVDRFTWWLEVLPAIVGAIILLSTWQRFPLTRLLFWLISVHMIILIIGGHYTYAQVPLGNWVRDLFDLNRNHYDRLGHFAQGFVPAIITREILIRTSPLRPGKWLFTLVTAVALAFSAFYELIEAAVALMTSGGAQDFLGTQGDVWDTQWDMALALFGALIAQLLLAKIHDAQLKNR